MHTIVTPQPHLSSARTIHPLPNTQCIVCGAVVDCIRYEGNTDPTSQVYLTVRICIAGRADLNSVSEQILHCFALLCFAWLYFALVKLSESFLCVYIQEERAEV